MLRFFKKIEKDVWVVLLLSIITTYTIFNLKHWNIEDSVIAWDVIDYYGYLPATFIYGDITLNNPNEKFEKYDHKIWFHKTEDDKNVYKTTMGMAMLYTPFFLMTHLYTVAVDGVANGYSPPYKFGICISSLFYFFLGLIFLRKFLRIYYNTNVVALTLFLIVLGTNLYYYVVIGVGMTHSYLFGLLSIAAYCTYKFYEKPSYKISLILGMLMGLMVLVRPSMILVILFFLFFNVNSIKNVKERLLFLKLHYQKIFVMLFFSFLVWMPQFIYWKMATGSYLYYSYTDEGFFFSDPQIINVLFSFRKGWLLYTPIMTFALFGLILLFKSKNKLAFSISITIISYFYLISCWWTWWFGGSFGCRTMIEMFPLLSFSLAFFIQRVLNYTKSYKISILTVLFLLMGFNLFQTRQAHEGLLHHDSMTKDAYFKILFKLQSQITREEVKPYLKAPDYEKAKKGFRD